MKLEERLYALRQYDSYGERYGIIMFFQSRKGICWFTNPAFTSSYICVDRYVPISKSHRFFGFRTFGSTSPLGCLSPVTL